MMLEPDRIAYCFSLTHEIPDVEFKGPGNRRDNPLFGKVIRGAMAMANRRGGGILIVGVAEEATSLRFVGLTPEQLATWKHEYIADGFKRYTNVPIEFDHIEYVHESNTFLILNIHEFTSIPVLCMDHYQDPANPKNPDKFILRRGAFYIRTLNKPESKEMLTSEEVRSLFELANEKAVQSFVTLTKLAGINIAPAPNDKELFDQQLQGWTGAILEKIRSRGYWDIHIRPVRFQQDRLPLSDLQQVLMRAAVNYRGWEFPYITPERPDLGFDWIELENQRELGLQAWRFFQSGHFAAEIGFPDDWGDNLTYPYQGVPKPGEILSVLDIIYRLTEVYGLASRLATSEAYRDERAVVIDITLYGIKGRLLNSRGVNSFVFSQRAGAETIPYSLTWAKEDIIARSRELVYEHARFIFERFGWNPSDQLVSAMQSQMNIQE